jgi:transcription elongation factor Elf1
MAMANDDTINESLINESLPAKDIVFECGVCGKSLVINALGAGRTIICPDCGAEQQVPLFDGVGVANPAVEPAAAVAVADEQKVEHELPEISDVLADAHEQINALTLENDELQLRRRFLEKRHALATHGLQTLRREMIAIRKAMDRTEAILETMEDPSASDTQPMT